MQAQHTNPILGFSNLPNQASEQAWYELLCEAGYTICDVSSDPNAPSIDLLLVREADSVSDLETRIRSLGGRVQAYLFIHPTQGMNEHPDARLFTLPENISTMDVLYKVESIVGLPKLTERVEKPIDPIDTDLAAEHEALKAELSQAKAKEAFTRSQIKNAMADLSSCLEE